MKTKLYISLPWTLVVLAILSGASDALANETRKFVKPMYQQHRLDWCLQWGSQCGEPAATNWCRKRGYKQAKSYRIAKDIGAHSPTKVLKTGQVCKEQFCDGFAFIVCERPDKPASIGKPNDGFTGNWLNVDPKTRSLTRIEIKSTGANRFSIHAWGKCRPKDCDWGAHDTVRKGNRLFVTWKQRLVERKMTLALEGEHLVVTTRSDYKDDRPTRVSRDEFKRPGLLIGKMKPIFIRPIMDPEGWIKKGSEQLSDYAIPETQRKANARGSFDRAMDAARRTGKRDKLRDTALQIADLYLRHQMSGDAKSYLDQTVIAYRKAKDQRGLARTLLKIASLYSNSWHSPDQGNAERNARKALSIYRKLSDERGQAAAIQQLGFIALRWNEAEKALEHFQKALEIRRKTGDQNGQAQSLMGIAASYEKMARSKVSGWPSSSQPIYDDLAMTERALKSLHGALRILRETGDHASTWRVLFNLGAIHENRGEDDRAVAYYQKALDASTAVNERRAAEYQLACETDLGRRLSDQFRSENLQCPMAAFGSTALLFDDEEEWDDWEE